MCRTGNEEKSALIRKMWAERLKGCKRTVEVWQQILSVRSLVVAPKEVGTEVSQRLNLVSHRLQDIETWLEFSSLCRRSGRLHHSLKVLTTLLGGVNPSVFVTRFEPLPREYPQVPRYVLICVSSLNRR